MGLNKMVIGLLAIPLLCAAEAAPVQPMLDPGLWQLTLTYGAEDARSADIDPIHVCLAEPLETNPFVPPNSGDCDKNQVTAIEGGYAVEMSCHSGGTQMALTGKVTGDFARSYHAQLEMWLNDKATRLTIIGQRMGDCPNGAQPNALLPNEEISNDTPSPE